MRRRVQKGTTFPLDKENVRNRNKHNDVRKKEQEPRNRFIPVLAKQVKDPRPEQHVQNLDDKDQKGACNTASIIS